MNCLICRQAELIDGVTSVTFERGEMMLVIDNVPAQICPSCADASVEEDVAVRLLQGVEALSAMGESSAVWEYESL